MIDKKTREKIVILLLERKKRLGLKQVGVLDLYLDLDWIKSHVGKIIDDLEEQGFFLTKKTKPLNR